MSFVKSLKSTIQKRIIPITLAVSVSVLVNVAHANAATAVDQETLYPILRTQNTYTIYDATANTGNSIARNTNITEVLAKLANYSTLNEKNIYTKVNQIVGYVDGIETSLTNINTNLTNIKSYVDGVEGYIDGLETAFTTNNTRLNEIKSTINSISTYNYTQVLSDILSNTGYLSTIDTYTQSIQDSIGYGTTGDNVLSKLTSLINSNSNIDTNTSDIYNRIGVMSNIKSLIGGRYYADSDIAVSHNVGGLSYPSYSTTDPTRLPAYQYNIANGSADNITDLLSVNNIIDNFIASKIFTPDQFLSKRTLNENLVLSAINKNGHSVGFLSLSEMLYELEGLIVSPIAKMQFVLADDDTIAAKKANQVQEQAVLSSFTGSGTASASASDFGDIATGLNNVKTGINTNVSVTEAFTVFNNSDGYSWFSNNTLNNLNNTNSANNNRKASVNVASYDYYDSQLEAIYSVMGVKK